MPFTSDNALSELIVVGLKAQKKAYVAFCELWLEKEVKILQAILNLIFFFPLSL